MAIRIINRFMLIKEHHIKMAAKLTTVFCKNLFAGKVAIVTGGGTGIGKAITKELAELGCNVVIASRKLAILQETAKEINHYVAGKSESTVSKAQTVDSFECNIRHETQVPPKPIL